MSRSGRARARSTKRNRFDDDWRGQMGQSHLLHRWLLGDHDLARQGKRRHHGCPEHESNNEMYEGRPHVPPLFADNVHMTYRPHGGVTLGGL